MLIIILLPDLRGGGAERLHVNLANHWHRQGLKVEFALMSRSGALLDLLPDEINVVDLGVDRIRNLVFPLAGYLRRSAPDVVIAAMWPMTSVAVLAWRLAGKPGRLYLSDHNQLSISCVQELNISQFLLSASLRLTYPLASGVIAVSEGVKRDMCRLGGFDQSRVKTIYNPTAVGISSHRESNEVREKLWGIGFEHHILSIGTLKAQKDHATLIRALCRLPSSLSVKLTILGDGSMRSELEALIVQLGLQDKVAMPGFVLDPYPWIRSADLFVLSSLWEGFGNVIVEALECGVPVVSTDCPSGPAEILENGRYGKLVPIQDPVALASAIEQSLDDEHDRLALIRRSQDFSVTKISDEYLAYMFPDGAEMRPVDPRSCPICGGEAAGLTFPYATHVYGVDFQYLKCGECKSAFVDPVPDTQTFALMYAKSAYHDHHYNSNEGAAYIDSAQLLTRHLKPGSTVLDFGCGVGGFLKACSSQGFAPCGVEFDTAAAQFAAQNAKCDVISVAAFDKLVETSTYDAIHVGDVLEHLPDPALTVTRLLMFLKPGGILFIEGPLEVNPSPVFWAARIFGAIKRALKPEFMSHHNPTHLFRTDAKAQHAFFIRVDRTLEIRHWQVYETGWPYAQGGVFKRSIAAIAILIGGFRFAGSIFGNRFKAIIVKT